MEILEKNVLGKPRNCYSAAMAAAIAAAMRLPWIGYSQCGIPCGAVGRQACCSQLALATAKANLDIHP